MGNPLFERTLIDKTRIFNGFSYWITLFLGSVREHATCATRWNQLARQIATGWKCWRCLPRACACAISCRRWPNPRANPNCTRQRVSPRKNCPSIQCTYFDCIALVQLSFKVIFPAKRNRSVWQFRTREFTNEKSFTHRNQKRVFKERFDYKIAKYSLKANTTYKIAKQSYHMHEDSHKIFYL